jgi:hypothetical protein
MSQPRSKDSSPRNISALTVESIPHLLKEKSFSQIRTLFNQVRLLKSKRKELSKRSKFPRGLVVSQMLQTSQIPQISQIVADVSKTKVWSVGSVSTETSLSLSSTAEPIASVALKVQVREQAQVLNPSRTPTWKEIESVLLSYLYTINKKRVRAPINCDFFFGKLFKPCCYRHFGRIGYGVKIVVRNSVFLAFLQDVAFAYEQDPDFLESEISMAINIISVEEQLHEIEIKPKGVKKKKCK